MTEDRDFTVGVKGHSPTAVAQYLLQRLAKDENDGGHFRMKVNGPRIFWPALRKNSDVSNSEEEVNFHFVSSLFFCTQKQVF